MSKLSSADKLQLEKWVGKGRLAFTLIYSASKDGCTSAKFHEKCNNKGPTISVAYTTDGYAYGGYTAVNWKNAQNWTVDNNSFLFRLKANNKSSYVRLESNNAHIYDHTSYGPAFGNPNAFEMTMFVNAVNEVNNTYQLTKTIAASGYGYKWISETALSLAGNCANFDDVEVYNFEELKLLPEGSPWRHVACGWGAGVTKKLKEEICRYKVPSCLKVPRVNVLLVGQVGSGKSSFINTVNSVFRSYVTFRAAAGSTEHSLTSMYRMYDIRDHCGTGNKLGFRLCDTMGLEDTQSLDTLGFPYLLDGNVQDRYQFNIAVPFTPKSDGYRASPSLSDQSHVVAFVVDGNCSGVMTSAMLDKVRTLRMHANHRGVPFVILFTKIDCLDRAVKDELSLVYHSTAIEGDIEALGDKLGVPLSQILPIKNYHKETELNPAVDVLAMSAVRQMLRLADDYFEEQMDLLGVVEEINHAKSKQNIL